MAEKKRERSETLNALEKSPEEIAGPVLGGPEPPERQENKAAQKAQRQQDRQMESGEENPS